MIAALHYNTKTYEAKYSLVHVLEDFASKKFKYTVSLVRPLGKKVMNDQVKFVMFGAS